MTSNLDLWNKVKDTDEKAKKPVTFGRTFTAIDPYYQFMRATEEFGVAGEGWGYSIVDTKFLTTNDVTVLIRLWIKNKDTFVEQWGQAGLYTDNAQTKKDGDCMKKATTDGITKCLSMFGFSADIFLHKFCDNKYTKENCPLAKAETLYKSLVAALDTVDSLDRLKLMESNNVIQERKTELQGMSEVLYDIILKQIKKKELSFAEPNN
jgi:hypothetical protein